MSSCPHLDPASLLAQRAVSIRLGRRTTGCHHTVSAVARRAPLNDSSIQGSIKHASTSASAPTQVLQPVDVVEQEEGDAAAVHSLLTHRRGENSRASLNRQDGAVLNDAAPQSVGTLIPRLRYGANWVAPASGDEPQLEHQPSSFSDSDVGSSLRDTSNSITEPLEPTSCASPQGLSLLQGRNQQSSGPHLSHTRSHQQHPQSHHHSQQPQPPPLELPPYPAVAQNRTSYQRIPSGIPSGSQTSPLGAHPLSAPGLSHDSGGPWSAHHYPCGRGPSEAALVATIPLEDQRNPPQAASDVAGVYVAVPCWADGNLHEELLACRSVHSVQRFLMLNRPRLDDKLLGRAVVHLDHLVSEDPPDTDRQRQLLAGLLDGLMQRLRGRLGALGGGQLAATLCALSRLRVYDGELLREAAAVAQEQAAGLTTRQAAGLVWAFARYRRSFRFYLEPGWVAAVLDGAMLPRLPTARPAELAMTLYGIAILCQDDPQRPLPSALDALLDASRCQLSEYGGRELSMSMWALATLRHDPGPDWLAAFLQRCEAATRTFASGSAVVNVLYGLAVLERSPPAAWMQHFLWQAQRRMNTMDAQALVMLGWALGKLRYRPDPGWGTAYLRYLRVVVLQRPRDPHPPGLSTQQVAALPLEARHAEGLRQQQLWRQQQSWLRKRWVAAGEDNAIGMRGGPGGGPQQMLRKHSHHAALPPWIYNNMLWVLVRLSYRPNGVWMLHLCRAVQPHLHTFPPSELAYLLWALARLSFRPQADWLMECCAALRVGLWGCQPADSARALIALGKLMGPLACQAVDGELAAALAARLEPVYDRLQTPLLLEVLRACAGLEGLPPGRVLAPLSALLRRAQLPGDAAEEQQQQVPDASNSSSSNSQPVLASAAKWPATAAVAEESGRFVYSVDDKDGLSIGTVSGLSSTTASLSVPSSSCEESSDSELTAKQPNDLIPSKSESNAVGMHADGAVGIAPNTTAVLSPHLTSQQHLTARECANAVFAVGTVAARHGAIHSVRVLCGQLLLELLRRAEHLAPRFNGLDLVMLLQGVVAAGLRPNTAWLRRHEALAGQRLAAGALTPGMLQDLHKMYATLGYEPTVLAPPPPQPPPQVAAAATVVAAVPSVRKRKAAGRVRRKLREAAAVAHPGSAEGR